jgi:PhnB protein
MKQTNTYLTFDGNCGEAMAFYKKCLGGELSQFKFSEMPGEMPAEMKGAEDRIMHACLTSGPVVLMASDNCPGMPFQKGNNFSINLACESVEEAEKLFGALSEKGNVTMPLGETFWAVRFGMLTDQYGIPWMFNVEKPQSA